MGASITISSPAVNLHSPGAIGDVTPGTLAYTTSTLGGLVTFSADNTHDIGASGNRPRKIYTYAMAIDYNALTMANGSSIDMANASNSRCINLATDVGMSLVPGMVLCWYSGAGFGGAVDLSLTRSAASVLTVTNGAGGAGAIRGNITTYANATTGLVAGALAALTDSSLVIYANGVAYNVPGKAV